MDVRVKAAWVSVACNGILVLFKLLVGFLIGSVSVIAEAIHSLVDLLASFIALFAVRQASKPADAEHPYGHGKVENVSGTIEALLIFVAAVFIIKESIAKILHGGVLMDTGWGIAVMALSTIVNIIISWYVFKAARQENSIALEADAMHHWTDVWTSVGVMVGLILIHFVNKPIIDPVVAILVAGLIVKAAWDLTRESFSPLLDTSLGKEDLDKVEQVLDLYGHGFTSYHNLRTRQSGRNVYIDLHLVALPNSPIEEIHDLCDLIEARIEELIPYSDVLIHVEPAGHEENVKVLGRE